MKLNCKPGDLAIIIRPSVSGPQLLGMIVKVLHAAPTHNFALPDGYVQMSDRPGYWVVEFPRPIDVPVQIGRIVGTRTARYAIAPDRALRPIRDNDGEDETLQWVPRKVTA